MIASGLQLRNPRIPQTRKPIASTPFVLNFDGVSVVMMRWKHINGLVQWITLKHRFFRDGMVVGGVGHRSLSCYLEESLCSFVSFLLLCQKTMLIITNAIPIGRNSPILPLTTLTIMKRNPLIEKSVAAVLYDFKFLDGLPFIAKVFIFS